MPKTVLDKDFQKLSGIEAAVQRHGRNLVPASLAFLFLVGIGIATMAITGIGGHGALLISAAVIGGYMALNIGANDVANNMSPAVGSRALTIGAAVAIAAVCEAAGAIIAGGEVVATVSSGIIQPDMLPSTGHFITGMVAALFAAALWLNIATAVGAPVSTTHSIVGGVLGGGIAMAGFGVADWSVVGRIVASWVISPVMGGAIAAAFLAYIKFTILFKPDKLEQARRRVPMLVGIMAGAFTTYLLMKGLSRIVDVPPLAALAVGIAVLFAVRALMKPVVARKVLELSERKHSIGELFTVPLIFGAALLSFAHGSNDVANAIGPLAAIHGSLSEGGIIAEAEVPLWVLLVGALGISVGLLLYGPKLIRLVGSQITKLNRVRAYCVSLSAAITVIIASSFGIPVSSTHIAVGALFGVGFLREHLENRKLSEVMPLTPPEPKISKKTGEPKLGKGYQKAKRRYLVRRAHVVTIVSAWIITVPATATMAGLLALGLQALGLIQII